MEDTEKSEPHEASASPSDCLPESPMVEGPASTTGTASIPPPGPAHTPRESPPLSPSQVPSPEDAWLHRAPASPAERAMYAENWTEATLRATSGVFFVAVAALSYASWQLIRPYQGAILLAAALSTLLHPRSGLSSTASEEATCAEHMRKTRERWRGRGHLLAVLGNLISLHHFASYVCLQVVYFLGFHKMQTRCKWMLQCIGGAAEPALLVSTHRGRQLLQCGTVCMLLLFAHVLHHLTTFLVLHGVLLLVCLAAALVLPEKAFVSVMSRWWRRGLCCFFAVGVAVSCWQEVCSIAFGLADIALKMKSDKGLVDTIVRETNTVLARFGLPIDKQSIMNAVNGGLAYWHSLWNGSALRDWFTSSLPHAEKISAKAPAVNIPSSPLEMGRAAFALLYSVVAFPLTVVDTLYAASLFMLLFHFFMALDNTVLYYALAKLLRPLQPTLGEHHARLIERDIIASVASLVQSLWHLAWFHFAITFAAFTLCALPFPFFFATLAVVLALLPLMPARATPTHAAVLVLLIRSVSRGDGYMTVVSRPELWTLLAACYVESHDEFLLAVSSASVDEAGGAARKEGLHHTVVLTAIVLGFVVHGVKGIVLGPLTVILAKALFDNWDGVVSTMARSQPRHPHKGWEGTERKPSSPETNPD